MRARFMTRFAATASAVVAAAGLLAGGVADAAPLSPEAPIDPASLCALNVGPSTGTSGAAATTTTLFAVPASGLSEGLPVVLVAIVTPCAAKGTVQFQDGTANIGAPVAVTGGFAFTIAPTLAAGAHSIVAAFVPADSPFDRSSSAPVPLTVSPSVIPDLPLLQLFLNGNLFNPDLARLSQFLRRER